MSQIINTEEAKKKRAPGGGRKPGKKAAMKEKRRIQQQVEAEVDAREAAAVATFVTNVATGTASPKMLPEVAQELKDNWEAANGRLTRELQLIAVELNARRWTPSRITRWFQKELQISLTPQKVECYNPTKVSGRLLSYELTAYFFQKQKEYDARVDDINLSSLACRLQLLDDIAETTMEQGAYKTVLAALELAAKEMSDYEKNAPDAEERRINRVIEEMARLSPEEQKKRAIDAFVQGLCNAQKAGVVFPAISPPLATLLTPEGAPDKQSECDS